MKIETVFNHATTHKKNPFIRMEGVAHRALELDVCPRCYNLTLGDTQKNDPVRRYRTCPVCAWHGPGGMTLGKLLSEDSVIKGGVRHLR